MALIKCPECELQASDKAISCPHCGYPLKDDLPTRKLARKPKRQRLPNGFGRIAKLGNPKLRNPYRAMVTKGKDPFNKPIGAVIGYYPTYNEAYEALVSYNRNPYDLDTGITMQELYDKWTDRYFQDVTSDTTRRTITSVWQYCSSIYGMKAKDIRARHIKGCMEDGYRIEYRGKNKGKQIYPTDGTKARIKSMFNLMLDYALEYEVVDRNYARTFDVSDDIIKGQEAAKRSHINFSDKEMDILWDNVDRVRFCDWIIIQCYMGWRPQELATLRLDEINLEGWYMQAGMKTDAGKQRVVPIHSRIRHLVQRNYDHAVSIGSEYLFNDKGQTHAGVLKITYDKYAYRFNKVMDALKLSPDHRPHDPRTTFITMAKKAKMDDYALKLIVGHKIEDITEAVYTKRDIDWLREDIEKIK